LSLTVGTAEGEITGTYEELQNILLSKGCTQGMIDAIFGVASETVEPDEYDYTGLPDPSQTGESPIRNQWLIDRGILTETDLLQEGYLALLEVEQLEAREEGYLLQVQAVEKQMLILKDEIARLEQGAGTDELRAQIRSLKASLAETKEAYDSLRLHDDSEAIEIYKAGIADAQARLFEIEQQMLASSQTWEEAEEQYELAISEYETALGDMQEKLDEDNRKGLGIFSGIEGAFTGIVLIIGLVITVQLIGVIKQ